ncbi:MAG TPA: HD domain-containing protein [Clostridiaceae bacterium]|nr:HD domain-containing protein [Clostridiaceae bacterium]
MSIIDLKNALVKDTVSRGSVFVSEPAQVRSGRKNDFAVGQFCDKNVQVDFKIWDEVTFLPLIKNGPGVYDTEVVGSEYNDQKYLTVRSIQPSTSGYTKADFLDAIPDFMLEANWRDVFSDLKQLGLSDTCMQLINSTIEDPSLDSRFKTEGAAIRHHDNKIGGLFHHTTKMLRLLATIIQNNPELSASIDLLTYGIVVHDIGKVFEYDNLTVSDTWYASHRIRGIELLASLKDAIISAFDEPFYRQVQSIIAEHHGEYGDRPNTVAAAIVHYIDLLESQVTGIIQMQQAPGNEERLLTRDWGYLRPLKLSE